MEKVFITLGPGLFLEEGSKYEFIKFVSLCKNDGKKRNLRLLFLLCCCLRPWYTAMVMLGLSIDLTILFLHRLIPL